MPSSLSKIKTTKTKSLTLHFLSPVEPKPHYKGDTLQHPHFCAHYDHFVEI